MNTTTNRIEFDKNLQHESGNLRRVIEGCLIGTAVGDSIGLSREGLSRRRANRMFGSGELRQNFLFGQGMMSDDTEQSIMVFQSVLASVVNSEAKEIAQSQNECEFDIDTFQRNFSKRLRYWFLMLPAGIGLGTARACLKLWLGFSARNRGSSSAGNGAAMRTAILGVVFANQPTTLRRFTVACSELTHSDDRAIQGAIAISVAAGYAVNHSLNVFSECECIDIILSHIENDELKERIEQIPVSLENQMDCSEFADSLGMTNGVSGYVCNTVPVAIYCWLRHRDNFEEAVSAAIKLGGDSDTIGAIVGGLSGSRLGTENIPRDWIENICDWPRSTSWISKLAESGASILNQQRQNSELSKIPEISNFKILIRNIFFLGVVLFHGFRRLAPPY